MGEERKTLQEKISDAEKALQETQRENAQLKVRLLERCAKMCWAEDEQ